MTDDDEGEPVDMRPLLRLGAWGLCAVLALGTAVFAGRTEIGEQRAALALVTLTQASAELLARTPTQPAAKPREPDPETQRLSESLRTLTADRDRLADRVATLERNLSDLTGSIARMPAPPQAASTPIASEPAPASPGSNAEIQADTPPPAPPAIETRTVPPPQAPATIAPTSVARQRSPSLALIQSYVNATPATSAPSTPDTRIANAPSGTAEPARPAFAVDLAITSNLNALRARWDALRAKHPALLDGLEPLMSVRESFAKPGTTELHLIAGPLPDAASVARLCGALNAAGARCHPAAFDGQRLALR